ncbi:integrase [Comamonas thiooxydans]|uniref:hypothetical protein n=1 Tax=Comamonas TaxID=283 RepID=UPI00030C6F8A|nr:MULTISPECIES: hypothetical protein [Comamonas]BDR09426.1 integrase [Comamonas thiooxydans]
MAKKKDFKVNGEDLIPITPIFPNAKPDLKSKYATLSLELPNGREVNYDYGEYFGFGFDDSISAIVQELRLMSLQGVPEPYALNTIASSGIRCWFRFCIESAQYGNPPTLGNINSELIEVFCGWLNTRVKKNGEVWSRNTSRTVYQKVKTVLEALVDRRLILAKDLFRRNPFPGATDPKNRRHYIQPLSDSERERILRPLSIEVAQVFDGTHPAWAESTRLGLCIFAIFLKTGINPTPLLEMSRNLERCFINHPRVNRKILITFKRRADAFSKTPIEPSETRIVSLDVFKLCERVVHLSAAAAKRAIGTSLEDKLWVYERDQRVLGLDTGTLSSIADQFTDRHCLLRDDGTRLKMTSQLFRNTKINRIWRASRGDLLATARSASSTPGSVERYLAVTPEMLKEHRLAGEVLVETLSGASVKRDATPHSGCRDALNGELAPGNGEPCVDFLSCFRCKSQVIVQDDLYKLFSFYWALFSLRSRIGPDAWNKLFGWVVRVIDRDIAPRFDASVVAQAKDFSRLEPHPMWRSPSVLEALRSIL